MIMNKIKTTIENFFNWYTGNEFLHSDFEPSYSIQSGNAEVAEMSYERAHELIYG